MTPRAIIVQPAESLCRYSSLCKAVSRTAAESLGLKWEGCDIDPNYADVVDGVDETAAE